MCSLSVNGFMDKDMIPSLTMCMDKIESDDLCCMMMN
ncbi:hypothetical protein J2Z42_001631 [Clostridium algifaecis]|uniref:Uncharacterized protein n=1 Tax=Clostridium algifaecis TaxID=1472040 RepID=A0ABS4KSF4_9CLOT|nr:hypothetical protein [Clostridium algifaecis]